jgi:ATP-dependent DNA ligase
VKLYSRPGNDLTYRFPLIVEGLAVCTRCGTIGADVRPDWGPHVNKRRV